LTFFGFKITFFVLWTFFLKIFNFSILVGVGGF
jgi:hypothetical protein